MLPRLVIEYLQSKPQSQLSEAHENISVKWMSKESLCLGISPHKWSRFNQPVVTIVNKNMKVNQLIPDECNFIHTNQILRVCKVKMNWTSLSKQGRNLKETEGSGSFERSFVYEHSRSFTNFLLSNNKCGEIMDECSQLWEWLVSLTIKIYSQVL